jgi:hypothetical protein
LAVDSNISVHSASTRYDMLEQPNPSNTTSLFLSPVSWIQTVHTHHKFTMRTEAEALRRGAARFSVPGLGNVLELPFELDVVRGPGPWDSTQLPNGAAGYLACDENRTDELGLQRTAISGAISLPEPAFDDVWERVRLGPKFRSMIRMQVGPVRSRGAEETVWDRATQKALFIMDVYMVFIREMESPPGRKSGRQSVCYCASRRSS